MFSTETCLNPSGGGPRGVTDRSAAALFGPSSEVGETEGSAEAVTLGWQVPVLPVGSVAEAGARFHDGLPVLPVELTHPPVHGMPDAANGQLSGLDHLTRRDGQIQWFTFPRQRSCERSPAGRSYPAKKRSRIRGPEVAKVSLRRKAA